jgi:O-antigen/teichoic acid export membrane protein
MTASWVPPEHGTDSEGLQPRVARGLTWTVVELWGRQALNLLVFIVLAWLLIPDDFGLVALATVFVGLAQVVVDQGLGDALIQRPQVTRSHIDTAFWVAMLTGAALTVIGLVAAGPIASLLNQPELAPILQVLSLTFVLAAFSSIQVALLRRELAFRTLAVRTLAGAAGGGAVGIAMALLGFGAWALVGQLVASAVLSAAMLWWVSPWRPGRQVSWAHFRELFAFGVHVVGSDVLTFLNRNTDNLLIGAFLGTGPLGVYVAGYRLLEVSQTILVNVARKIAFPAFSRLQGDRDRMLRAHLKVTRVASLTIFPAYIGLAIIAPDLTILVFPEAFSQSGIIASILLVAGPALSLRTFNLSLLTATGHPDVAFRFRLIATAVNIAGFAIAVSVGLSAVAAAFAIGAYALMPLNLYWTRKYAAVPIGTYLSQLLRLALATAIMAAAMLAARLALGSAPLLVLVAAEVGVGVVVFLGLIRLLEPHLLRESIAFGKQAVPRRRGDRRGPRPPSDGSLDDDPDRATVDPLTP